MKTLATLFLLPFVTGFGVTSSPGARCFGIQTALQFSSSAIPQIKGKTFQLEEMEDQDKRTTEVLLKDNGAVDFKQTTGPLFKGTYGSWQVNGQSFQMELKRTYEAGHPKAKENDVGEFEYTTDRLYKGTLGEVGGRASIEGKIVSEDGGEIGFFEMIDSRE